MIYLLTNSNIYKSYLRIKMDRIGGDAQENKPEIRKYGQNIFHLNRRIF